MKLIHCMSALTLAGLATSAGAETQKTAAATDQPEECLAAVKDGSSNTFMIGESSSQSTDTQALAATTGEEDAAVQDGTSNTIMVGEKHIRASDAENSGGGVTAADGTSNTLAFGEAQGGQSEPNTGETQECASAETEVDTAKKRR